VEAVIRLLELQWEEQLEDLVEYEDGEAPEGQVPAGGAGAGKFRRPHERGGRGPKQFGGYGYGPKWGGNEPVKEGDLLLLRQSLLNRRLNLSIQVAWVEISRPVIG